MKRINLVGQRFGRLIVIKAIARDLGHRVRYVWLCQCDCGNESIAYAENLRNGRHQSCGCLQKEWCHENKRTHGMSKTPIYNRWSAMITRCCNPNSARYKDYGGRGITVCNRWRQFENFYADMGDPPSPTHSMDRVNNDGPYSPENCRWSTPDEQANNARPRSVPQPMDPMTGRYLKTHQP